MKSISKRLAVAVATSAGITLALSLSPVNSSKAAPDASVNAGQACQNVW